MKTSILAILVFTLASPLALGQAHIVKQRAKELNQQNNQRQGVAPTTPTPPAAPSRPATPAQPQPTVIQPTVASPEALRKYDAGRVKSALAPLKPGATVTSRHTEQLAKDLAAACRGTAKPSPERTSQLAKNLGSALTGGHLNEAARTQLADDLVAILNGNDVPASKTEAALSRVDSAFRAGGMDRRASSAVIADLKAITGDLRAGASK